MIKKSENSILVINQLTMDRFVYLENHTSNLMYAELVFHRDSLDGLAQTIRDLTYRVS